MIYIYQELVKKYIGQLSPKDLEDFATKNDISYTKDELIIVYQFIPFLTSLY